RHPQPEADGRAHPAASTRTPGTIGATARPGQGRLPAAPAHRRPADAPAPPYSVGTPASGSTPRRGTVAADGTARRVDGRIAAAGGPLAPRRRQGRCRRVAATAAGRARHTGGVVRTDPSAAPPAGAVPAGPA